MNDLDDENNFVPSGSAAIAGCNEELEEFFASTKKQR